MTPLEALLQPGVYGLVFGGDGAFGSSGIGYLPINDSVDLPGASYFSRDYHGLGGIWDSGRFSQVRMLAEGHQVVSVHEPGTFGLLTAGILVLLKRGRGRKATRTMNGH